MNKGESKIIGYTTMESMHIIWKRRWKRIIALCFGYLNMDTGMRTGHVRCETRNIKAHVAYIPNGQITGLSKIARVVETFARRLQVQERLTTQIRDCIQDTLNPLGVAVVIEASHTCMTLRGVQKANAVTTTSAFSGIFLKDERTRNEFLNLIR